MATQTLPLPTAIPDPASSLEAALDTLEGIRRDLVDREGRLAATVADLPPDARPSARNLIHYLGLRAHDLGPVQRVLAAHGWAVVGEKWVIPPDSDTGGQLPRLQLSGAYVLEDIGVTGFLKCIVQDGSGGNTGASQTVLDVIHQGTG